LGGHGKHGTHGKLEKQFDYSQNSTYFRRKKIDATDLIVASGASRLGQPLGRIAPERPESGVNRPSAAREWRESPQSLARVAFSVEQWKSLDTDRPQAGMGCPMGH